MVFDEWVVLVEILARRIEGASAALFVVFFFLKCFDGTWRLSLEMVF